MMHVSMKTGGSCSAHCELEEQKLLPPQSWWGRCAILCLAKNFLASSGTTGYSVKFGWLPKVIWVITFKVKNL